MTDPIPALTLTQPWATLVTIGAKRIETRTWASSYRGPLLIHAAKDWTKADRATCFEPPFYDVLHAAMDDERFGAHLLPLGAIVALVELRDIQRTDQVAGLIAEWAQRDSAWGRELVFGNYAPGRYAWTLGDVRPFAAPVQAWGKLGLWYPPADVWTQVAAQLGTAVPV